MPLSELLGLNNELSLEDVPVQGAWPEWLRGSLLRNGPAKFETGQHRVRHWFDGLAMLHRFSFAGGRVAYANQFLKGRAYRQATQNGQFGFREFATDPCQTLLGAVKSLYQPDFSDNAAVNVGVIAGQTVALGETPLAVEFDPVTLRTLGGLTYQDNLAPKIGCTTAHPHYDFDHAALFNYGTQIGPACSYNLYYLEQGSPRRNLLGSLPVAEPAYMHSFAMTPNYLILAEFPLVLKEPLKLALGFKPFIENFEWQPDRETIFRVVSKREGREVATFSGPACFAFHHINAFEQKDQLVVDLVGYQDASVIGYFYLDRLDERPAHLPASRMRRYRLVPGRSEASYEELAGEHIELPRINYEHYAGRPYRFVYGIGRSKASPQLFEDQLVKLDLQNGSARYWSEEGCYPGEPIFVASPEEQSEDGGVVLSVVLDGRNHNSFLLVLEAASFEERARAIVPQPIPLGLHGAYLEDLK